MNLGDKHKSRCAAAMLFWATSFWGASFPIMKALGQSQRALMDRGGSWLVSSFSLAVRFGASALLLGLWNWRELATITRLEAVQGLGLGLFCGPGILFQMDGVMHTSASTSAFLTQCYCIFIPLAQAWRRKKVPSARLAGGCIMVTAGVMILANVNWSAFRLGRGEAETIIGSLFFTGQILWLERPAFAANRNGVVTQIMFAVVTAVMVPVVVARTGGGAAVLLAAYTTPMQWASIGFLALGCTLAAYTIMNCWQPFVPAAEAGLIYCCEPLFASVYALFLPAWLSAAGGIHYANEMLTPRLLAGGGLILGANLLVLWRPARDELELSSG